MIEKLLNSTRRTWLRILISLGLSLEDATKAVADAGSNFESKIQADFVRWFALVYANFNFYLKNAGSKDA